MGNYNRKGQSNEEARPRGEYLTAAEFDRIRAAAGRQGRFPHRDATLLLVALRHGLRCSEVVGLKWDQIDLAAETVFVRRAKGSKSGVHTLERDEVTALKKLAAKGERSGPVFRAMGGGGLSTSAVRKIVARAGVEAGIPFPVHPHMLRHTCGFELHRRGMPFRLIQEWLGHRNIRHTELYTSLDTGAFKRAGMWGEKGD